MNETAKVMFKLKMQRMTIYPKLLKFFFTIALFASLGIGYLYFFHVDKHEVIMQIRLAHVSTPNNNNNTPLGFSIEEPVALANRMKNPYFYGYEELKACGVLGNKRPEESLLSMVRVSVVKGSTSAIDVKVTGSSGVVSKCAESIYKNIQGQHDDLLKPLANAAIVTLKHIGKELRDLNQSKFLVSEKTDTVSYLALNDKIRALTEEQFRLEMFLMANEHRGTRLLTRIPTEQQLLSAESIPFKLILILSFLFATFVNLFPYLIKKIKIS
jgi:hypothetical protein